MKRQLAIGSPVCLFFLTVGVCSIANSQESRLDPTSFVVIGEGMAAGLGDFSLSAEVQEWSFPAQLARQVGVQFSQPLIEPPGVGNVPGLAPLPAIVPAPQQTTVLSHFPPAQPPRNLSVPGFRLTDSLHRRAALPLIQYQDAQQTLTNLVFYPASLGLGERVATQVELALQQKPTFVLVELGYFEAVEAVVEGDAGRLPDPAAFRADYRKLVTALRGSGAEILLTTIPNPVDTAYCSSLEAVGALLRIDVPLLRKLYGLRADDLLTVPGLLEIGYQLTARSASRTLPPRSVISAATAAEVTHRIQALNQIIASLAQEHGALLYDLHGFFKQVKGEGIQADSSRLSGDFLGGFFLLNGLYPGITGHALLANDILRTMNQRWGTSFSPVRVDLALAKDPTPLAERPSGPVYSEEMLAPLTFRNMPPLPPLDSANVVGFMPATTLEGCNPPAGVPGCGLPPLAQEVPLKLPPGREQVLALNPEVSYYGDALRVVDCPDDRPLPGFEAFPAFGTCGNLRFGGLAMGGTSISGKVRVKFSEPVGQTTHFEISHPGGLVGENGMLAAPQFFRLPLQLNVLQDAPDLVSSGDLDLKTGQMTNLAYYTSIFNTALWALAGVNPGLPTRPLAFPGSAGSVRARFEQRADGLLDLTVTVDGFLPLGTELGGQPVRLPLPFCGPDFQCASIVARGTSLHPHIHFSTKAEKNEGCGGNCPSLPENTLLEFTSASHDNSFGDVFDLKSEELGGSATGESHLLGRVLVQFGTRFGNHLPVSLLALRPGGLLVGPPKVLERMPPGISPGFVGFDEILRFPKQSYHLKALGFSSDPMNITFEAVNLETGRITGDLLHRGFVLQELMSRLLEVEPCTPRTSFCYQGPAGFERGGDGQTIFSFNGQVMIPYPEGYRFPAPDGAGSFVAGPGSRLDPFLKIHAVHTESRPAMVARGQAEKHSSSLGQEFSYRYSIPCQAATGPASFEYVNHTQQGTFHLTHLSWVSCSYSGASAQQRREPDLVTFTGFGSWSRDPAGKPHFVAAQISTAADAPFVGIWIDDGSTSNVNLYPSGNPPVRARP